jgi:phosphoribosyl 1,2-cyclic phosphate phosphodiesterase
MRAIILGCGTSTGVPRIDGAWGDCDPNEPKNRRSRGSIVVEKGDTRLLIDTSPDLRNQFLVNGLSGITAVAWTHDHADQTHGLDDLRILAYSAGQRIIGYADDFTHARLRKKFGYCFETMADGYPPIIEPRQIDGPFMVGEIEVQPFRQDHGKIHSLGFRFGDLAYSNDVVGLDETAFDILAGVRVWIVDALRYKPHPTHSHLAQTLEWIARLKPERAILTNLNFELDYNRLCSELPAGVEPAYDGMVIEC